MKSFPDCCQHFSFRFCLLLKKNHFPSAILWSVDVHTILKTVGKKRHFHKPSGTITHRCVLH